jgi:small multidrug resistance pump
MYVDKHVRADFVVINLYTDRLFFWVESKMKSWLLLSVAILTEVVATSALKASDGFTKIAPSVLVIIGYVLSFYFLSLALKGIPVGVAYATWAGLGIVLITLIAWVLYGQKLDLGALVGMGFILIGVVIMNLFSNVTPH